MGYYTDFSLTVAPHKANAITLDEQRALEAEIDKMNVFETGCVEFGYIGENTWCDYEKDMLFLSSRFPDILFTLRGAGENPDDRWVLYFLDGKRQGGAAEIIFPEFDENAFDSVNPVSDNGTYRYQYQDDDSPIFQPLPREDNLQELL